MADVKTGQDKQATTQSGRPIMLLLDLLGKKQCLRILWELRGAVATFRVLQEKCGAISPTILNRRLKELREAGIVTHQDGKGYGLSREGVKLMASIAPLNDWAKRWGQRATS